MAEYHEGSGGNKCKSLWVFTPTDVLRGKQNSIEKMEKYFKILQEKKNVTH